MSTVEVLKVYGVNSLLEIQDLPTTLKCEVLHQDKDNFTILSISERFSKTPAQMAREAM